MDPAAWAPPAVTPHACNRFRERIEALDDAAIQAVFDEVWRDRKNGNKAKSKRHKRRFQGSERLYLESRMPSGKLVYWALSEDRSAVLTVFDVRYWNFFVGETSAPPKQLSHLERAIRAIEARDAGR